MDRVKHVPAHPPGPLPAEPPSGEASDAERQAQVRDPFGALRAALGGLATDQAFRYPDSDNQMEEAVFSFAKRDDERRAWRALLASALGAGAALEAAGVRASSCALDVGCGLGAYVDALAASFPFAAFLDPDRARVEAAAARRREPLGARFFCARLPNVDAMPAALVDAFAWVQAVQVLGHVPVDAATALVRSCAALVTPGGWLLVAVPFTGEPVDDFWVTSFTDGMARPQPVRTSPRKYDALATAPQDGQLPVRHFAQPTLEAMARHCDLEMVRTLPYHWFSETRGDAFVLLRKPGRAEAAR